MHKRKLAAVCCCIAILASAVNVGAADTGSIGASANQQPEIVVEKELLTEEDCSNGEIPRAQESDKKDEEKDEEKYEEENEREESEELKKSEETEESEVTEEADNSENSEDAAERGFTEKIVESVTALKILQDAEGTAVAPEAELAAVTTGEVFSMNVENIDSSNNVDKKGSPTINYRTESTTGTKYIEFGYSGGAANVAMASEKITSDGYIDFSVRLKNLVTDKENKMWLGSGDYNFISFDKDSRTLKLTENTSIANTGSWMEFRVLLKKNTSGIFEKKILLKNSTGTYEEKTAWESTGLSEIKKPKIYCGYMTIDVSRFAAVHESVDGLYPTVSVTKTDDKTAEITFSRKMSEACMTQDMIKIKGNTVTDFSYDKENNKITITTEKSIDADEIMFRSGMRADNDMPLLERISTTSLTVKGASISSGAEVSLRAGKVEIEMSEALDPETVTDKTVTMTGTEDYSVNYDAASKKIVVSYGKLTAGGYSITVGKGALSVDGDFLMSEYTLNFTAAQPAMAVKSASIENGASVSMAAGELCVEFSTKPDIDTLNKTNIKLTKKDGTAIRGIYTIDARVAENKVIIGYGNLEAGTSYKLSMSGIEDIDGGALPAYSLSFSTKAESIYNYDISEASENEDKTHKYMNDEDVPYMRLSHVKYYPDEIKETVAIDLELRVDKTCGHRYQLAKWHKLNDPEKTYNEWLTMYSVDSNGWSFNGSTEKYENSGDWTKLRIIMDKDGRDTYALTWYMMNKNGAYEKVSQLQTEMDYFNYNTYGVTDESKDFVDFRKMSYRRLGNGYLQPAVLSADYSETGAEIYFTADMDEASFAGAVSAKDSKGAKIEGADMKYDATARCLKVTAADVASVELGEGVKSTENMPLGDISGSLEKKDFSVSNISLTDGVGGESISALAGVDTVSGTALVENHSQSPVDVTLFTVMFDKDGMVKKLVHKNKTVASGKSAYIYDASLENIKAAEGDYVKVFVWKSDSPNTKPAPTADFVRIGY